ncbi:MAG: tRNA pseudouridine(38-40) synthase TruA [Bacteroidetes bacterium GWF2_41_9]|nr:MAG: tRNA pseudouridine(38-40) synthase TruA [Bacteroidetes bacterium GWF2_41_9]HAM08870.1 tRNA pseudouridine(38-40) synthase TruA [Bacteroidales bacterium]
MIPVKSRYFLFLSYKGTNFHGWQIQPEAVTVQKTLDIALGLVLKEKISTTGAGRTDTGVHALVFCAHFDSIREDLASDNKLIFRLNRLLPPDIAVKSLKKAHPDANARYSAISRTYEYHVTRVKDPFTEGWSWFIQGNINISEMNEACKLLLKQSDFTSFSRLHSDTKTNICKIHSAEWVESGNRLVFKIRADRFLRNMVRAIVGTMIDIGFCKLDLHEFEDIIFARDRCRAGKSAPAKGLFLTDIEYPSEIFI